VWNQGEDELKTNGCKTNEIQKEYEDWKNGNKLVRIG
jgi:hypothetical protein